MTIPQKPTGQSALPPTTRSLPIALMRGRECVMGPIREMLSDSGITEQQWRILRVLEEIGPLDSTTLSERACLLLPSQTRIVQTMLQKGLVSRQSDTNDRRRQTVSITAEGQKIIQDNLDQAKIIADRFVQVLGEDNYEKLLDLLEELNKV